MARRKRSEKKGVAPTAHPMPEEVSWPVQEVIKVRCPVCGLLVNAEPNPLREQQPSITEGPYKVEVMLKRFGGKTADGAGFMSYDEMPGEEEKWKKVIIRKLKAALKQLEQ